MGYSTRPSGLGHKIKTFWPDDTDSKLYFCAGLPINLEELNEKIKEKWPDKQQKDILIGSEYIHTDCLGYDLHDPSDWTLFITAELKD